jgi:hypothetical protein
MAPGRRRTIKALEVLSAFSGIAVCVEVAGRTSVKLFAILSKNKQRREAALRVLELTSMSGLPSSSNSAKHKE